MASFTAGKAEPDDSVWQAATELTDKLYAANLGNTDSPTPKPPQSGSSVPASGETTSASTSTSSGDDVAGNELYTFHNAEAHRRWCTEAPVRIVDYSLGYPVLVCDDEGKYVSPSDVTPPSGTDDVGTTTTATTGAAANNQTAVSDDVLAAVQSSTVMKALEVKPSGISGSGVFAATDIGKGEYIGAYRGTVLTDEEWESTSRAQSEFAFVINDGANGVVIDGQSGCAVNELKFINHSCEPNAVMREVYVAGMWHVAVIALRDIGQGEEIMHDYALITEDEDSPEAQIACTCGADKCRGTLFRIVDF